MTPQRNTIEGGSRLFQAVNSFVGQHVDCTDIGEDLSYHFGGSTQAGYCVVVVRCVCGAEKAFSARHDSGMALVALTRRLGIATTDLNVVGLHA
jgi:hypothetical protein